MSHAEATAPVGLVPALRSGGADVLRLAVAQALAGTNSASCTQPVPSSATRLPRARRSRLCGLSQDSSNLGLQRHIIAMYAPSFFTGRLITRFGAPRVVATGLALTAASTAIGLLGMEEAHFWLTLILLGLGWNFGFVDASALVLECPPSRGTDPRSVGQRLPRVRDDGVRLVFFGRSADELRMGCGALGLVRSALGRTSSSRFFNLRNRSPHPAQ
jgi:MFS family permease